MSIKRFLKKKSKLGIAPKVRSLEEINKDYSSHATQLGHKTRIMTQLQMECDDHTQRMIAINAEGMAFEAQMKTQPTPPPAPESAPTDTPPEAA